MLGIFGPSLSWRVWFGAVKGVFGEMNTNNIGLISAGVAFWGMLALFPATGAVIAVWGFIADPVVVAEQLETVRALLPVEVYDIIAGQINGLVSADTSTLGWTTALSLGAAMWSSRAGTAALITGLNAIYREKNRLALRNLGTALAVTFMLMGVALTALACVVILPVALAFLPLGPFTAWLVASVRWIVVLLVVVAAIGVVYRYGPNRRKARTAWITPGAIIAVIIWGSVSWAFSFYLSNFGNYNEVYGALGAVIAMLMWLYLSAFSVLLGASLNAELELRTKGDTTVGPARPRGERRAHVADRHVETPSA